MCSLRHDPTRCFDFPDNSCILAPTMKTLMYALRVTLLLGSALYFFTHVDLTNLVFFQGSHEPREEAPQEEFPVPCGLQPERDRMGRVRGKSSDVEHDPIGSPTTVCSTVGCFLRMGKAENIKF